MQVDIKVNEFIILDKSNDHRKDSLDLSGDEAFISTNGPGNRHKKTTTKGRQVQVTWKGGSSSWKPLKDLKDDIRVQLTEYSIINIIDHELAFACCVKDVLYKRDRIVSKVKTQY